MSAAEITASRNNGRKRPKGYIESWKPHASTRALLEQVEAVLDEYADQLPLTVRQVFYRLVGAYGYEKTENAYDRLADKLVLARRSRRIPFDCLRDDGVMTVEQVHYAGLWDFHDETARRAQRYRLDRQAGQSVYVEMFCEAAGMIHQLNRVASRYAVQVFSGSGFDSLTAKYEIAHRALARNVPTVLLHLGDFDPSGESIFEAMAEDVRQFVRADRVLATIDVRPVRVALTADQVSEYGLPTSPAKKSDKRSRTWTGGTCQLEALAPDDLANIVEDAIVDQVDLGVLDNVLEVERQERAELLALPRGGAA